MQPPAGAALAPADRQVLERAELILPAHAWQPQTRETPLYTFLTDLSLDPRGVWLRLFDAATPHTPHTPTRTPRGPLVPLLVWRSARCGGPCAMRGRETAPHMRLWDGV